MFEPSPKTRTAPTPLLRWRRRRRRLRAVVLLIVGVPPIVAWFTTGGAVRLAAFVAPSIAIAAVWVYREIRLVRRFPEVRLEANQRADVAAIVIVFTFEPETVRRAIGYARAINPRWLQAVTVSRITPGPGGLGRTVDLQEAWVEHNIPVPLAILDSSPWRASSRTSRISDPIINYAEAMGARGAVWFFVPVAVSPDWVSRTRRLASLFGFRGRLMLYRNARVISVPTEVRASRKFSVPWQLKPWIWWSVLVTDRQNTWRRIRRVGARIREWY